MRRRPLAAALAAGVVVLATAVGAAPANAVSASAIASTFDPGNIISDAVMFNPSTMTAGQIQTFLNTMVPSCQSGYTCLKSYRQTTRTIAADPMCSTYRGASNESSATIIAKVAEACGVNPQTLLVTLQKEQGLVTDSWPDPSEYRKATGYGCPDSQSYCDANYNGFFNQVYKAAWAFKRYTTPPGTTGPGWTSYSWYPLNTPVSIGYNPDPSCGFKTVTLRNKATASLYYYTPYVPNSAALAAGFGSGNACSAYGNRNFYLYFTTWFGSTHAAFTATGAIGGYYSAHRSALGAIQANARPVQSSDGSSGSAQTFVNGTVYSSTKGTFAVLGAARTAYNAAGGSTGALGWPTADQATVSAAGGGTTQSFAGGGLYLGPVGTFTVTGAAQTRYVALNGPAGTLGWPTGRSLTSPMAGGGTSQAFQSGTLTVAAGKAAFVLQGDMLTDWTAALGWPVEDASRISGVLRQRFSTGGLYATSAGMATVSGDLYTSYESHGDATGALGLPTASAVTTTDNGGGSSQTFAGGALYDSAASGVHMLRGAALTEYVRRGGTAGNLGWPTVGRIAVSAKTSGAYYTFQSGRIFSSKYATVAVRKDFLAYYLAHGGPAGSLGWPTATAAASGSSTVQTFQHAELHWSANGVLTVTKR